VNGGGGEGFPRVEDFAQGMPLKQLEEDMDVVGHHYEGIENVALSIEMAEGIDHYVAGTGFG